MKSKFSFFLVPIVAVASLWTPAISAQSPDRPNRRFQAERRARWESLTEEERARLKAAHQKALSDPAVLAAREKLKQARREFREIMRPALLRADPSVQAILDKIRAERSGRD